MYMDKMFILCCVCLSLTPAHANFIDDQKVSVTARNYQFDRNFTAEDAPYPAAREWAQAFIFNYQSGYTEGLIGLGLDLQADLGLKLDSDAQHTGTGILEYNKTTREPVDEFHRIYATAKIKASKSEVKAGALKPRNPVIFASPARLLDQTYQGVEFTTQDIQPLKFVAGYVDEVIQRDDSEWTEVSLTPLQKRFSGDLSSSNFIYSALEYQKDQHHISYYYAQLNDIYQQHAITYNLNTSSELPVLGKVQLYRTLDSGAAQAGKIDNFTVGSIWGWKYGANTFSLGGMLSQGDTALAYLSGGDTPMFVDNMSSDFVNKNERVWSVRYDRHFADFNLSNLNIMLRYNKGTNIELPEALGGNNLKERSLDSEIRYQVASGVFKSLNIRLRNTIYRNNFASSAHFKEANESRVNLDYSWTF